MNMIQNCTAAVALAGLALLAASLPVQAQAQKMPAAGEAIPTDTKRKPEVVMVVYPGMTMLDMIGPQAVLSRATNVHLVWKNTQPIVSDSGVMIQPTESFADCPKDVDVLFIGGGGGQAPLMNDPEVLGFLADRGSRAKYVTSVCSGSLILGAAGLLRGFKATSYWSVRDVLPLYGAIPVNARVVIDRNRMTGGGITAGIDFGLTLLATLEGEDVAKMTQLALEYNPQPPFIGGSPEKAGSEITQKTLAQLKPWTDGLNQAAIAGTKTPAK